MGIKKAQQNSGGVTWVALEAKFKDERGSVAEAASEPQKVLQHLHGITRVPLNGYAVT